MKTYCVYTIYFGVKTEFLRTSDKKAACRKYRELKNNFGWPRLSINGKQLYIDEADRMSDYRSVYKQRVFAGKRTEEEKAV